MWNAKHAGSCPAAEPDLVTTGKEVSPHGRNRFFFLFFVSNLQPFFAHDPDQVQGKDQSVLW
jgi:hypothetical protein